MIIVKYKTEVEQCCFILEGQTLVTKKSSILILWESLVQKNPKAHIGNQSTIEDLFVSHKITRMNSCTSILNKKDSLSSIGHKMSTPTFKG